VGALACQGAQQVCVQVVQPSPRETCNDGIDNDCNGKTDEGCVCKGTETQPCYSGTSQTQGVGECKAGSQTCQGGKWGLCKGEVTPRTEVCGNGKDDSCDGAVDEGCPCDYKGKRVGVCKTASNDSGGKCKEPSAYSAKEICGDRLDNNCDGVVDEGCPCNYLGKQQGVCKSARRGRSGKCIAPNGYNAQEQCGDGKDNDCDGLIDKFPPGDFCLHYGRSCLIPHTSPAGNKDVCVKVQRYCDGSHSKCPAPFGSGGLCEDHSNRFLCTKNADCDPCNQAIGGAPFYCIKGMCARPAP